MRQGDRKKRQTTATLGRDTQTINGYHSSGREPKGVARTRNTNIQRMRLHPLRTWTTLDRRIDRKKRGSEMDKGPRQPRHKGCFTTSATRAARQKQGTRIPAKRLNGGTGRRRRLVRKRNRTPHRDTASRMTHMEEFQHVQLEHKCILCARNGKEMRSDRWMLYSDTETRRNPSHTLLPW